MWAFKDCGAFQVKTEGTEKKAYRELPGPVDRPET
jgi:hypothetical protein